MVILFVVDLNLSTTREMEPSMMYFCCSQVGVPVSAQFLSLSSPCVVCVNFPARRTVKSVNLLDSRSCTDPRLRVRRSRVSRKDRERFNFGIHDPRVYPSHGLAVHHWAPHHSFSSSTSTFQCPHHLLLVRQLDNRSSPTRDTAMYTVRDSTLRESWE